MKTAIAIVTFFSSACASCFGQITIQALRVYRLESDISVKTWKVTQGGSPMATICTNSRIRTLKLIGDSVKVKLKRRRSNDETGCASTAKRGGSYIIDKTTLGNNINVPSVLPIYGFLTIPFKYEFTTSRMYPGGEIGGLLGAQKTLNWDPNRSMSIFLSGTAGYSRVALNNTNIQSIDPSNTTFADAFSYGIAGGLAIEGFQLMIVRGIDSFSVSGSQQQLNWLMIGFGYSFIKPAISNK